MNFVKLILNAAVYYSIEKQLTDHDKSKLY